MKGVNKSTGKSHKFIDRTGMRNGRLLITHYLGVNKHQKTVWAAVCDCGKETTTATPTKTQSCGCLQKEIVAEIRRSKALPYAEKLQRQKLSRKKIKAKQASNPVAVMHSRLSRLHRWAIAKVGAIKSSPTFEQLGYTVDEFVAHLEKQFLPNMGWHNMGEWQIDHITPISTAKTVDDVVALNQLSNLRPLWSKENNQKKNKIVSLL